MEQTTSGDGTVSGGEQPRFSIPVARTTGPALEREIHAVTHNEVTSALLSTVHGLLAVLNEHRQVLALNKAMFDALGISDLPAILGLRLGEIVRCVHAIEAPNGCGTSDHCPTCGAAIAQVAALAGRTSGEQLCAIEVPGNDSENNLFFRVCASPITIAGRRFVLLFVRDVSAEQRAASLEQIFLHDLRNTTQGISMGASLLAKSCSGESADIAHDLLHLAERLSREIEIHRCLASSDIRNFRCQTKELSITTAYTELRQSCRHHPALDERELEIVPPFPDLVVASDPTILHRILYNMVINALEATPPGGIVRVATEKHFQHVIFTVWNATHIPPEIARRIFQRNFSTKTALGHGLGTYSMKLLGEKLLLGHVSFTTSPDTGTTFMLELPTTG